MKKLLLIVLLFVLVGCGNNYFTELGYSKDEAKIIKSLAEEDQVFFSENFGSFTTSLLDSENFKKENASTYILFNNLIDGSMICDLVNDGTLKEVDLKMIETLVNDQDYNPDNLLKYLDLRYETTEYVVDYINSGSDVSYDFVKELAEDKLFISDNIPLYLEHKDAKDNVRDLIEYVNTLNYLPYYSKLNDSQIEKYGYYTLVNKYYVLDQNYEPSDMVEVASEHGVGRLRQVAYDAFIKMFEAAKEEGMSFYITSPYRSFETQSKLYNNYLASDSQENVDIYSARPGSSEHQLGLAVDILKNGYDFGNFYETPESSWLKENAYKYGFILRYPEDKVEITGYKYEPWHYRYVGDIAEKVYNSGVSYDEFFEKYVK